MAKKKNPQRDARMMENLIKTVLQYIQGKRYSPMTEEELLGQLGIPSQHQKIFLSALEALLKEGAIALERGRYLSKESANKTLVVGTISVHAMKGFGFVKVEGEAQKDVFIPKHSVGDAVDGDTVEVEITDVTPKGPEGRVIAILKRSRTHLACIILEDEGSHFLAYSPLLGQQKSVRVRANKKDELVVGDRVICKVIDWKNDSDSIDVLLSRHIGHISDPSCDVRAAIEEFGLPDGFTKEAIEEAKAFGTKVSTKGRLDLTDLDCVTIDPDTAKDYDDAISLYKDEEGHFLLGVHIADVSSYVKAGSHLDKEAFLRCNSTYFPGFCLPMLPEELSNELCSLKPKVKRLTVSVLARFDKQGTLLSHRIERACIKSRKRLTYNEAYAILQKKQKSTYLPLLERMVDLCHLFKRKRFERGSIDFALSEGVIRVDEKGVPQRIERVEYDITHQMIEEFMLKANEIVAHHLEQKGKKLIFRIHEEPSSEAFEDFYTYARTLGFSLPAKPTHRDIQKLFTDAKDSTLLSQLSVSFIRSMKMAFYSSDNLGHYGLALEHYCHFTSPIRRYTDLIIERLLFDEEDKESDVEEIAKLCSEKERLSMRAESSVTQLKKLRLAAAEFEAQPERIYEATVTRVKPFALFFEVPDFALESSLHVSEIGNDYFEYNAATLSFRGSRSGKTFSSGAKIQVKLLKVDLIRQQATWQIGSAPQKKSRRN